MSNLLAVSQRGIYKIYIYSDLPIPESTVEAICLGEHPSDIKATLYIFNPTLTDSNSHYLGVVGKAKNLCDEKEIKKWETIKWNQDGIELGNGDFLIDNHSLSSLQ